VLESNGTTEVGIAVGVVRGAVERVDHPEKGGIGPLCDAFLQKEIVRGKGVSQKAEDRLLAGPVHLRNEVRLPLEIDRVGLVKGLELYAPGIPCGENRGLKVLFPGAFQKV